MSSTLVTEPYPAYFNASGLPLDQGYIYIGQQNTNPMILANQIPVFWDSALSIPAAQPIRTSAGFPTYLGKAARFFVGQAYSITVLDKNQQLVFSDLAPPVSTGPVVAPQPITSLISAQSPYAMSPVTTSPVFIVTTGASNFTFGLPSAASMVGYSVTILKIDTGAGQIQVTPSGTDVIGGFGNLSYWLRNQFVPLTLTALASGQWAVVQNNQAMTTLGSAASPYTMNASGAVNLFAVTTGASNFTFNLPSAASMIGQTVTVIKADSGAGAVNVTPNGSDVIGGAGNTPQAVSYQFQQITLTAVASGQWVFANSSTQITLISGSPYSLAAFSTPELFISANTNPFIVNLPSASTCYGYRIKIVNGYYGSAGLVKILPYSGQLIQFGSSGPTNAAIYLQTIDQGGQGMGATVDLVAQSINGVAGWQVVGGNPMPEPGSVDAAGTQYYLGKLRHLPLGNTSDRTLYNGNPSTGWNSAISVTGTKGIPAGAKAVLVKAAGTGTVIWASDNNSNTPTGTTAHPTIPNIVGGTYPEIIIPLNASGQFYLYALGSGGAAVISAVGYYMGD